MTDLEVKERILQIFKAERRSPDVEYVDAHFMDFLTNPAHKKNQIRNSFRGAWKYHKFMDKIELEFGICFALPDYDKHYSVDSLTQRVQERIQKRRGNIMILNERNKRKQKYYFEIFLILILVLVFTWQGITWISTLLALLIGAMVYWLVSSKIHDNQHNKKLSAKILGKQA